MNRLSSLMKVSYCASGRPALLLLLLLMLAVMPTSVSAQVLERWVYVPANFLVPEEVQRVEKIMTEASKLGFTHLMITDSKFCRLHEMLPRYFDHLGRIKTRAKELNLKLVPCVFPVGYSNDLLSQNVHLADGLPVRDALFEVLSGEARLVADPEVALPSFRDRKEWNFIDDPLKSDGDGLRVTDPTGENCRTMKAVKVTPYRHYHVSVKIKTEDFKGQPQVMILDSSTGRRLNHTNLKVGRTQDWSIQHITFNSLGNETVNLYIGAWGPTGGSMWLSEPQLEECGLLNVLRRDGTPVIVRTDTIAAKTLTEGVDFEHVSDPQLGNVPYAGEFEVFHASPSIRMKGTWKDGTRLRVSWFHPHVIYDGQICGCVTEPEFVNLLQQQADGVEKQFPQTDRMMSHDEWRLMGWDESFRKTGKTPGQVAAENVGLCTQMLKRQHADRRIFVWSDMFDPHHNAVDNYYLVNGDLTGAWEGLDKDVIIMNWNFDKRADSLKFFAERGHQQVLAGYYDADAEQIGQWLDSVRKKDVKGVVGVMYTTWRQDYSQLREFASVVDRFEEKRLDQK